MKKYHIIYTFAKDLTVTETVEAENKSEVIGRLKDLVGFIEFYDDNGLYHRFHCDKVKLISISE